MACVLAIDQGTSSSRAIVFDEDLRPLGLGQRSLPSIYPHDGWVEQDPHTLWKSVLESGREAIAQSKVPPSKIEAIGITNQRETSIIWDANTSEPCCNAIVWQDRRTAEICEQVQSDGLEELVASQTGLVIDPYFSSTKLKWLLDNPTFRGLAERGDLRWGTVDSFLVWRLTKGRIHATDATNASRTQLFDINQNQWSAELLKYFGIPRSTLPKVMNSMDTFGVADSKWFGREIPILSVVGDQQSALVGQGCFESGMTKTTYGTGCFLITNTGKHRFDSTAGLLSTIAYRLNDQTTFGVEGSIFNAGTSIKWLRDKLKFINAATESEAIATKIEGNTKGVYVVPAFTGLGAPHWKPHARALVCGLTLDSGDDEIVVATLKSVAFQTADLLAAIRQDRIPLSKMRVDGGMVRNSWFCQFLSDVTELTVDRPMNVETTSTGAATLALLGLGQIGDLAEAARMWSLDESFHPTMDTDLRIGEIRGWTEAVRRTF
ncbi:MAG: glycerol kinase GlpK [Gammaproteobacteria bacterium]|nr:glycerol kinase GlpK [Gammaproteobacteria bacterium]MYD79054.1 glycerol kinase GlpK [Gammaproteobacteria bacterium]